MILKVIAVVVALVVVLAIVSAIGVAWIGQQYPPVGRFIEVTGGRLHVLELGDAADPLPVVLLHGASGSLADMRVGLGDRLAAKHRVILIDRPGHGWSDRPGGDEDVAPARQAALVAEVLDRLGVKRAIVVGHSLAGAVVLSFALNHPERVAGMVLLAPVAYPWPGGIAWVYSLTATPVIGPLFARTLVVPIGYAFLDVFCRAVFAPQPMPQDYPNRAAIPLSLRPSAFVANAHDVAALLESVKRQSPRYAEIMAPTVIIAGDRDTIVSPEIHARALARTLPHAKLTLLPGVGHAVQHVAADLVIEEIDRLAER